MVDEEESVAVAQYHVVSMDVLPHADGTTPSGLVTEVQGMDRFSFEPSTGRITSISTLCGGLGDEDEAQAVNWDRDV